jgi:indole-3-glycerol phosphate synthase
MDRRLDEGQEVMGSDFLSRIIERKRQEVEAASAVVSESQLMAEAGKHGERRPFFEKLSTPGPLGANIIAEVKRGSPSRGIIREDLDPKGYAQSYERGGAAAISVLTDRDFFKGSPEDLQSARAAVRLPVLRKDFVVSTYQVYESAVMGADAVLLIVRALSRELLKECLDLCREIGLDALVEVHTEKELDAATLAGARLIGINNRDLSTFKTDIETSISLVRRLPPDQIAVSESGIHDRSQIERLLDAGVWNFLIGESLVKSNDKEGFLAHLLGIDIL